MKEENTAMGTLRMASIIRSAPVANELVKKAHDHVGEVIRNMNCTDRFCPYHSIGGQPSDFGLGIMYNDRSMEKGRVHFVSTWWCCDRFMAEVETACLNTLYQYFGESEVEVTPDHYYQ